MNCKCGKPLLSYYTEGNTLVGYYSPPGHDHDDNCLSRYYECAAKHTTSISIQRRCSAPGCDWVGKAECFCHKGTKVTEWPDLPYRERG